MTRLLSTIILAAAATAAAGDAPEGRVFLPRDGESFAVTAKDVVRFTGPAPGSTGYTTKVEVTEGAATVTERAVYGVVAGKVVTIGGGGREFDVRPAAGKTGRVKVTVTRTPPGVGAKADVKSYEFEVR